MASPMPKISAGSSALSLTARPDEALLDSYSPERRGATLDVFANATKSTRFMTPPTRGWRLAREAALSLSLKHEFPRGLANPRQMQPYTYSESPLTPYAIRDAEFAGGPVCGSVAPNAELPDGSHLLDQAGIGMTAILFCGGAPSTDDLMLLDRLRNTDKRSCGTPDRHQSRQDADGEIARLYAAAPGTLYLLRPDLHIAGRWKTIAANEVLRTAALCLGRARA